MTRNMVAASTINSPRKYIIFAYSWLTRDCAERKREVSSERRECSIA